MAVDAAEDKRQRKLGELFDLFDRAADHPESWLSPGDIAAMGRVGDRCEWTETRHEKVPAKIQN